MYVFSCARSGCCGWAVPADRLLIRINRHRRIEHRLPIRPDLHPPLRVVQCPMMMTAQQNQVVEIRWATIVPVNNMMGIAPPRRSPAPRERTPTIANRQRPPLRNRRRSHFLTAVERNTILVQEDPGDGAVARQHPGSIDADRAHQSVHANPNSSVDGRRSFKALRSVMSFADAVTVMCGFTPPSIGPNPARSYRRNNSQNHPPAVMTEYGCP